MEEKEIINLWKKAKISHAEFKYISNNIGHLMESSLSLYSKKNKIIELDADEENELEWFFENEICLNIDLYQDVGDSDYLGETGIITIKFEKKEFVYKKDFNSDYRERCSREVNKNIMCQITKKQAQFLEEYVSDMSGGEDGREVNYKKDFILTEKIEEMIDKLHEVFLKQVNKWTSNLLKNYWNIEEIEDESERYEIEDVTITEENGKFYVKLNAQCEVYSEEL